MRKYRISIGPALIVVLASVLSMGSASQSAPARSSASKRSTASASTNSAKINQQITGLYRWYVGELKHNRDPLKKPATLRRYISKRLAKWLASPAYGEYGADYIVDAQDFDTDWDQATVSQVKIQGKTATATAVLGHPKSRAEGIGPRKLQLKLLNESGIWKVDRVNGFHGGG